MKIYGVALLAGCYFSGLLIGEWLGMLFGIPGNMGGVGFSMLFLILLTDYLKKTDRFSSDLEQGMGFWNSMYIPVVIAMASIQNVDAALHSGTVALVVGIGCTVLCFMLLPLMSAAFKNSNPTDGADD
ncbi:MAG: malonate transporter subunit MadL [Bacteroidetes bacterium]|nr:malonate transporter subunit MadL [Bacteroidota bacterium]